MSIELNRPTKRSTWLDVVVLVSVAAQLIMACVVFYVAFHFISKLW